MSTAGVTLYQLDASTIQALLTHTIMTAVGDTHGGTQ